MNENGKKPVEQALDLLVYAPLGFALSFREFVAQAAEKGRQQVQAAKVMGQFAVQIGQQQAEKKLGDARRQAEEVVTSFLPGGARPTHVPEAPRSASATSTAPPPPRTVPAEEPITTSAPSSDAAVTAPGDPTITTATPDAPRQAPTAPVPDVASLAIPGYDTLSASQIVQRLGGLTPTELDAIKTYERAGRGRKTILNKVDQLASGA